MSVQPNFQPQPQAVIGRVLAVGDFELESPAHFGGQDRDGEADMMLVRDSAGNILIPGSSIAGACRSYLAAYLLGPASSDYISGEYPTGAEQAAPHYQRRREKELRFLETTSRSLGLAYLFGTSSYTPLEIDELARLTPGDEIDRDFLLKGGQSALIVSDAYVVTGGPVSSSPTAQRLEIRDGVAIDSRNGQVLNRAGHGSSRAVRGSKYDLEVVPRKTVFRLQFELVIRQFYAGQPLKPLLNLIINAFKDGKIGLGARTRRGLGAGRVKDWQIQDLDFTKQEDVYRWINRPPVSHSGPVNLEGAVRELAANRETLERKAPQNALSSFRLDASFFLKGSLLVRSYRGTGQEPDATPVLSAGQPVLPGTSVAGAIRHRAERITNTLTDDPARSQALLDPLFGLVDEENKLQRAGRLRVAEHLVQETTQEIQTRLKIDRLTGGALSGYLFEEKALWGSPDMHAVWKLELELVEPKKAEMGLLLQVLKDLWVGDLPLGGGNSVGRGRLAGLSAHCSLYMAGETPLNWELSAGPDGTLVCTEEDREGLEALARALVQTLSPQMADAENTRQLQEVSDER